MYLLRKVTISRFLALVSIAVCMAGCDRTETKTAVMPAMTVYTVEGLDVRPTVISLMAPVYNSRALDSDGESVVVFCRIDSAGNVVRPRAMKGPQSLRDAATEAVAKLQFTPGIKDGKRVSTGMNISVPFVHTDPREAFSEAVASALATQRTATD